MSERYKSVDLMGDETVSRFTMMILIAALTAALAQASFPLPGPLPPFSLQPFGAFFAGLLLGPLWGGLALLLYLIVGIAGAPVFSNGHAGLGYVLVGSGTGGFLVGFVVGAAVAGAIAHRQITPRPLSEISVPVQALALLAASAVFFIIGIPWMAAVLGLSLEKATMYMVPYMPVAIMKVFVAVGIVKSGVLDPIT